MCDIQNRQRTIHDKIDKMKEIINVKTDAELAQYFGKTADTVSKWRQRKTIPYKNILYFEKQTGVNKDIILFKQENEPNIEPISMVEEGAKIEYNKKATKSNTHPIIIEVPYLEDIYASAGGGAQNYATATRIVRLNSFLLERFKIINPKNIELINITGDSMEPYFQNGDVAIVERIQTPDQIKNGDTIILNLDGDIYIKQIEKVPNKPTIILKSKNPLYEDTIINDPKTLNPIATVRGRLSTF